jgi:phosphoglycerate dehydrogenase-like enzyme
VNNLLILAEDAAEYAALLEAADLPGLEVSWARDATSAKALAAGCNLVLGEPPLVGEILESAQQLEWVQSTWAGIDSLCRSGLRRDYLLTGAKGIFGRLISEYVMTYLFALERRVFTMRDNQFAKRWKPMRYRPAHEITLGIAGLGSIGRELARSARDSGIRVTGFSRSGTPCDDVERVYAADGFAEFLARPDYVALTLPDTPATENLVDAEALELMKPSSVLINVGRGGVVNESDLIEALSNGVIAGAVLDVFEREPLDEASPLWRMPNVFITPHTAATSFPEDIVAIFIENYQRFINSQPLLHRVDFELGY